MKVENNRWQVSSRDVWAGIHCIDHCLQIAMAKAVELPSVMEKIGGIGTPGGTQLRMKQGIEYEEIVLAELEANLGSDYIKVPDRSPVDQTLLFARLGKAVIAQAPLHKAFEDFDYVARADLLVRSDLRLERTASGTLTAVPREGAIQDGRYCVWDVKHSSMADEDAKRGPSQINREAQLAMSFEAILAMGIGSDVETGLVFKERALQVFDPNKLLQELEVIRKPIFDRLISRSSNKPSTLEVAEWRCAEPSICSKSSVCDYPQVCKQTRALLDDLSQIPNIRVDSAIPQYKALGVDTVAKLATVEISGTKISKDALAKHLKFAKCLVASRESGKAEYAMDPGLSVWTGEKPLPKATEEDLFLDMESFTPLNGKVFYYMVGVMNQSGEVKHFISDSPDEQGKEFQKLANFLSNAIAKNPDMHIFVVSSAEATMFKNLDSDYPLEGESLTNILNQIVDVKTVASSRLIVSTGSFGLKEMEPFFREAGAVEERDTETSDGDDSQWQYYLYLQAKKNGDLELADKLMADIKRYNSQDCINTKHYYDWLASIG